MQLLLGDARKATRQLGWEPSCKFHELVDEMVRTDLQRLTETPGAPITIAPPPAH